MLSCQSSFYSPGIIVSSKAPSCQNHARSNCMLDVSRFDSHRPSALACFMTCKSRVINSDIFRLIQSTKQQQNLGWTRKGWAMGLIAKIRNKTTKIQWRNLSLEWWNRGWKTVMSRDEKDRSRILNLHKRWKIKKTWENTGHKKMRMGHQDTPKY